MANETSKKEQHKEKSLEKMTVKELREIALTIPHSTAVRDMKKDELIALIKEARGIKSETLPKQKKKVIAKLAMTKAQMKAQIRELKVLKLQAHETRDKAKAKLLRHRINRLKKKSRNVAGA